MIVWNAALYSILFLASFSINNNKHMALLGYALATLAGISLGLIGSGGSILTVPILVYLMDVPPSLATAYSLFVVGAASFFGAINYWRNGHVSLPAAASFALPAFFSVYMTRLYIMPALPDTLLTLNGWVMTKSMGIMLLFAVLMITAAVSMLRSKPEPPPANDSNSEETMTFNYPLIAFEGLVVGVLTGMVGAGGGFIIVPALVLLVRLPMKVAIGTSLLIVTFKSLIGFLGDLQAGQDIDWTLLLSFAGIMILGILIGGRLANYIQGQQLKKGFGWFVLAMATYIIIKELFL